MNATDPSHIATRYRPCVGIMLLNARKEIWIGHRLHKKNPEGAGLWWQMPQGGIDEGEQPLAAAWRELAEETSVTSAQLLGEAPEWYRYDLPSDLVGQALKGKYRGQTQKWFAFLFTGSDDEIQLNVPGQSPEFDGWRWASQEEVLRLIVPFKLQVYQQVIHSFQEMGILEAGR